MFKKIFLLFIVSFFILTAGKVFAKESILDGVRIGPQELKDVEIVKIGAARLKASLADENQYDSNIFLTPEDPKSGYINVIKPTLLLDFPMGIDERHLIQLLYDGQIGLQGKYHKQDYVNSEVGFNGDFKLPFGYYNLQNIFDKTSDRAGTEFTTQVKREENTSATALGVKFNKFAFELGYSHYMENYVDNIYDTLEYNQDTYSSTLFYQLFPKTKALLEYDYGVIDYKRDPTRVGTFDQVRLGLRGDLTGKTIGIVKFGYQDRKYNIEGRAGYNGLVAEGGIITEFSENTRMNIKLLRTAAESIYLNNNYYLNNMASIELKQRFLSKFNLIPSLRFSRNLYPEFTSVLDLKRHDSIGVGGLACEYDIKNWWQAKLAYQYSKDNSNVDNYDYTDHLVSFSFNFVI